MYDRTAAAWAGERADSRRSQMVHLCLGLVFVFFTLSTLSISLCSLKFENVSSAKNTTLGRDACFLFYPGACKVCSLTTWWRWDRGLACWFCGSCACVSCSLLRLWCCCTVCGSTWCWPVLTLFLQLFWRLEVWGQPSRLRIFSWLASVFRWCQSASALPMLLECNFPSESLWEFLINRRSRRYLVCVWFSLVFQRWTFLLVECPNHFLKIIRFGWKFQELSMPTQSE